MVRELQVKKERGQQLACHVASVAWKGKRCRLWLNAEIATFLRENKVNHVMLIADTTIGGSIVLKPMRDSDLQKYYNEGIKDG